MRAWLEDHNGRRFPFDTSCSIGRLPGSTVTLDDRQVSRRHALIFIHADGDFWLLDFGSSNGTLLNGQAVREPRRLNNSDRIEINSHKFQFRVKRSSAGGPPSGRGEAWEETEKKFTSYESHGHGVIVLAANGEVQMISPHAVAWLKDYFPNAASATSLPKELSDWLRGQRGRAVTTGSFGRTGSPLVLTRDNKRLHVQLAEAGGDQQVLLFTEQELTSLQSSLQKLGLTRRESEVMFWLTEGKTNAEIGRILNTSPRTVERHVGKILAKLNVENRASAIVCAMELTGKRA